MNSQRENMETKGESSMEDEVELLLTITENIWVQCDNPDCQKWRKIQKDEAAKLVPSIPWFCYMNSDSQANDCSKPEDDQVLYEKVAKNAGIKFVMSELEIGDLVWAKTAGYSRWPAVISKDPYYGLHTQLDVDGDPFSYHVEYLGNPHTHCWVYARHVELYGHRNNKTVDMLKAKINTCPAAQSKKKGIKKKGKRLTCQYKTFGLEDAVEEAESLLNMSKQARLQVMVFEHEPPGLHRTAPKYGELVKGIELKQSRPRKTKSKSIHHNRKPKKAFGYGDHNRHKVEQEQGQYSSKRSNQHQTNQSITRRKNSQSFTNSEHRLKIVRTTDLEDEAVVPSSLPKFDLHKTSMYYTDLDNKDVEVKQAHQEILDVEGLYSIDDFEKMVKELQDDIEGSSPNSQELTNPDDDCLPLSFNFEDSETLPSNNPNRADLKEFSYFTPQSPHPSVSGPPEKSPVVLEDMESDLLAMEGYFMDTKEILTQD